jgi:hypothetical protein
MKANEAPEKIYIQPNAHDGWFETNNLTESLTEYTRTDAFIKKACEWLSKHARKYYFNKDGRYLGTDELVEDFELSMEL